ncbi:unnamed protein product, partial [Durusdinium trenchii]
MTNRSSTKHKDIDDSALLVHVDIEQVDNSTLVSKHVDIEQVAVEQVDIEQSQEALLVSSSPGFGVLDSGCGRSIIGERTLQSFEQLWRDRNQKIPSRIAEKNLFKYGNGEQEVSQQAVQVPVVLGGRMGSIRAASVKGDAPLLISRAALQKLNAVINFSDSTMTLFTDQRKIPLQTNEAGQFVVRLIDDSAPITDPPEEFQEVMLADEQTVQSTESAKASMSMPEPADELPLDTRQVDEMKAPVRDSSKYQTWSREDSFLTHAVLRTLPSYRQASESLQVPCDAIPSQAIQEVMMVKEVVMDSAQTNLGEPLQRYLEHLAQSDAEHVTGVPESDQVQDSPMPAVKSAEQTKGHDEASEDPTLIDKSPMTPEHAKVHEDPTDVIMQQPSSASGSSSSSGFKANQESQAGSTSYHYGPIRHRVEGKSHGAALYRPSAMKHEDFVDMMREVVPRLLDAAPTGEHKRSPSEAELSTESQPPAQKARPEPSSEVLSVQDVGELMVSWDDPTVEIEIMIAQYMEKKLSKE